MGIQTYLILVLHAVNTNLYVILSSYTYTLCAYACVAGVGVLFLLIPSFTLYGNTLRIH